MRAFEIRLNNPTGEYTNGDRVSGKIVVNCDSPGENIGRLYILCTGTVEVSWHSWLPIHHYCRDSSVFLAVLNLLIVLLSFIPISGTHTLWNVEEPLRESNNSVVYLPEGESVFHFDIPLPEKLVTSCKFEYGYVQYKVKAVATRPWYRFDSTTEQILTVRARVPVNSFPDANHRVEENAWKTFCCCCCETGKLNLRGSLPTKGYCIGDRIMLKVEIDNQSGRTVEYVSASLIQRATFSARDGTTRETSKTISFQKIRDFSVEGVQKRIVEAEVFVPEILPSGLGMQTIIDVQYYIQVEAHMAWYAMNLTLDVPVRIGTTR